jgi:putative ABC transport system permease protein
VTAQTVMMQIACAAVVGLLAGLLPSVRAARVKIVDGLRYVG